MAETLEAELLLDCRNILAEGIQWHAGERRLYWTDIHGKGFWSSDQDGGSVTCVELDSRLGSFAFLADGRVLGAFEDGLAYMDPRTGFTSKVQDIETDRPTTRLNDGRCDRDGRFIFGGLDEDSPRPLSAVYSYHGNGEASRLIDKVGCTNGLCFSPDGRNLYFTDTPTRRILRYDYERRSGAISNPVPFAEVPDGQGFPDGSCVDKDGGVWNARFGGRSVQRYTAGGQEDVTVSLPVSQVTCACFGGTDLDRLYITTARENFTEEQERAEPIAGGIFHVRTGHVGLEESGFKGPVA